MSDRDRELQVADSANVIQLPSLASVTPDQVALAVLMLGSLGTLAALRKGMKGIGPIELTGSTVAGVEFAALFILVGAAFRLAQIQLADTPLGRALAFIH